MGCTFCASDEVVLLNVLSISSKHPQEIFEYVCGSCGQKFTSVGTPV